MQILTVTLNPALDLATSVAQVVPDRKLRCAAETAEAGGGGVNVARAITQLGGQAQAWVALGGANGEWLGQILDGLGLDWHRLDSPGPTRHSFSVTDEATAEQYRFVLTGPSWTGAELDTVLDRIVEASPADAMVVFSGSMPPGAEPGFLPRACARLAPRRVVIDTSGPHLEVQATGPAPAPFVLRMDSHEAMALSGKPLATRTESAAYAEDLRQRGAGDIVIIARGKDGSVMATAEGRWHTSAENDVVVSAIGAGDSFVGGFCLAIAGGAPPEEALRRGAAAASAAVMSPGTQLCHPQDYARVLPLTGLTRL
ncbi:1-phosphofructokinase family hexose kinase [Sagittula salina]|uniref:Phosphofructokinase n=1 Tax=Sagittula salina TaxID=2820268 RepID=A0A940MSZ0_9RHOB|nr:1-phosphofructokinase family hexose kinase [Sagittula salina]MBP0484276.1 1-phosphofructokinase family hexose kinase [Sagittula salina]